MSPNAEDKNEPGSTNISANEKKRIPEAKEKATDKRVYIQRNSLLTDLMEVNHLQSVYNISVAVCFLLFLSAVMYYAAVPHKFHEDIAMMRHGVSKLHYALAMWLMFHVLAYLVLLGFRLWLRARHTIHSKVADASFLLLYVAATVFLFVGSTYATLTLRLPPISGFAVNCEQVRIFMKLHSFVRECVPRALRYRPEADGKQDKVLCPSTKHYFYYLFAPTLIYRDFYPMTERRNFRLAIFNLSKLAAVIFISYCAFTRFNVDMFKEVGLRPFSRPEAALVASAAMAVGAIMMFLMFYGILHCWLNFAAELLRFGDKLFYHDWWNSTSFSQYYRRWNRVVHDWLHAYVYQDSQRLGLSRSISLMLVFFVSALVHEYIIALALGFFYPVLCVTYSSIGVLLLFFTEKRTSQFWNTFMWGMLFSGWGVVITGYSTEWFARINCPKQETPWDFFIPRSWSPTCHMIDFS